jgi:hypothetical protein
MAINLLNTDVANMKLQFHVDPSVPSPFKRILFWLSSETKNVNKRRKEKIPSVALPMQWKEYHTKKENEKKKLKGEKLERKSKREEKKTLLRSFKEKKKRSISQNVSSDSDSDHSFTNDNLQNQSNLEDLKIYDYVIVKYENNYLLKMSCN